MAAQKEFVFKIQVDTKDGQQEVQKVAKNLQDFDKIITDLNKEIRSTDFGSASFVKLNSSLQQVRKSKQEVIDATKRETEALDNNAKATEDAGKGFIALSRQIRETRKQLQAAQESGDEKAFKKLKNELDDLEDKYEIVNLKSKKFGDALAGLKGPLGIVGQGIQGVEQGFKLLIANPIVAVISAIVGAFLLMKKALSSTAEGQQTLNRISAAFGKILGPVLALVESVALPIFRGLAEILEFVAAGFSKLVSGLGVSEKKIKEASINSSEVLKKQAEDEKARQEDLRKKQEEETKKRIEDQKKRAEEYKAKVKETQQAINAYEAEGRQARGLTRQEEIADETKKYNELLRNAKKYGQDTAGITQAYNEKVKKINDDFNQEEFQKSVKAETDKQNSILAQKEIALQESIRIYGEESLEVQAIQDQITQAQLEGVQKQIEIYSMKTNLTNEEIASLEGLKVQYQEILTTQTQTNEQRLESDRQKQKSELDLKMQGIELNAQADQLQKDMTLESELAFLEQKRTLMQEQMALDLAQADLTEQEKLNIKQRYANEELAIEAAKDEIKTKYYQADIARLSATANALGQLADLVGKETLAGKSLSIAQALINTYQGTTEALKQKSVLPSPFDIAAKVINVATVLATGLKSVQAITAVQVPTTGGGGGGISGPSAPSVPKPRGLASGGMVFGAGSRQSDSIPAMLSNGESVINATSTRMFRPLLSAINTAGGGRKFAAGGVAELSALQNSAMSSLNSVVAGAGQPIKAYVVSQDMSNQQMFDRAQKSRSMI